MKADYQRGFKFLSIFPSSFYGVSNRVQRLHTHEVASVPSCVVHIWPLCLVVLYIMIPLWVSSPTRLAVMLYLLEFARSRCHFHTRSGVEMIHSCRSCMGICRIFQANAFLYFFRATSAESGSQGSSHDTSRGLWLSEEVIVLVLWDVVW